MRLLFLILKILTQGITHQKLHSQPKYEWSVPKKRPDCKNVLIYRDLATEEISTLAALTIMKTTDHAAGLKSSQM